MSEIAEAIPHGAEILAVVVAVAALISSVVPDEKLPGPVAKILNYLALNVGKAANDPAKQGGSGG